MAENLTVKQLKNLLRKAKCAGGRCTIRLSAKKAQLVAQVKKHKLYRKPRVKKARIKVVVEPSPVGPRRSKRARKKINYKE